MSWNRNIYARHHVGSSTVRVLHISRYALCCSIVAILMYEYCTILNSVILNIYLKF